MDVYGCMGWDGNAMGAGLPYAIGCQIGNPNKKVIDIDGDGSFLMTMSDMKTIVEYNLPVKILILNNINKVLIWKNISKL